MFSKACKYAMRSSLYLAAHSSETKKIGVAELAKELDVPQHFLAKVLQKLTGNGLVSSTKGPNGGFYFDEKNRQSTLEEIILCVDGPSFFSGCIMGLPTCTSENPCPLHVQAHAFRDGLRYQLIHQTIEEIAQKVQREGLAVLNTFFD